MRIARCRLGPGLVLAFALALLASKPTGAADELLTDPGFESPAGSDWTRFSSRADDQRIATETDPVKSGRQSLKLTVQETAGSYQGVFQSLPVTPGKTYRFRAWVREAPASPRSGTGRGQISLEWKSDADTELRRDWGPDWGAATALADWTRFELTGSAPDGATRAHVVITQFAGDQPAAGAAFLVDDASVTIIP